MKRIKKNKLKNIGKYIFNPDELAILYLSESPHSTEHNLVPPVAKNDKTSPLPQHTKDLTPIVKKTSELNCIDQSECD